MRLTAKLLGACGAAAVTLTLVPSIAAHAAPVKAGAPCTKVNAQVSYKGNTYVCKRVKGRLVWTLLKPTFSDNYQAVASDLDECRLRETGNVTGAGAKGFPIRGTLPATGELKIAIIPVDFANAPGEATVTISWGGKSRRPAGQGCRGDHRMGRILQSRQDEVPPIVGFPHVAPGAEGGRVVRVR